MMFALYHYTPYSTVDPAKLLQHIMWLYLNTLHQTPRHQKYL